MNEWIFWTILATMLIAFIIASWLMEPMMVGGFDWCSVNGTHHETMDCTSGGT